MSLAWKCHLSLYCRSCREHPFYRGQSHPSGIYAATYQSSQRGAHCFLHRTGCIRNFLYLWCYFCDLFCYDHASTQHTSCLGSVYRHMPPLLSAEIAKNVVNNRCSINLGSSLSQPRCSCVATSSNCEPLLKSWIDEGPSSMHRRISGRASGYPRAWSKGCCDFCMLQVAYCYHHYCLSSSRVNSLSLVFLFLFDKRCEALFCPNLWEAFHCYSLNFNLACFGKYYHVALSKACYLY